MIGRVNTLATAAILRAFCDSLDEAERVMRRVEGCPIPENWRDAWRDIEYAVALERAENH